MVFEVGWCGWLGAGWCYSPVGCCVVREQVVFCGGGGGGHDGVNGWEQGGVGVLLVIVW